jgi:Tfp pilus assembly protein PilN
MSDTSSAPLDLREQIARIDRAIAETTKFTAEATKYIAEQRKPEAEARQFDRNRWQIVLTAMTAGAALFGAGAAFLKLLT